MRLRLAGGEKYLVAAGGQRINQRLAGKVERRPNLARLEDVADAVRQPGAVPVELVLKAGAHKQFGQPGGLLLAELVFHDRLALAPVAVAHVRV